jgi:hypothetical protein
MITPTLKTISELLGPTPKKEIKSVKKLKEGST